MSNPSNEEGSAPRAGKLMRGIPIVLACSIGLFAGGTLGVLVLGPFLAKRAVAQAEAVAGKVVAEMANAGTTKGHGDKGKGGGHGEGGGAPVYTVDNLVLNPAQSGGTRFLVASLALEVSDAALTETMKQRDPEVRDAVLRVLGAKTVSQLADMTSRPVLKQELGAAVDSIFGEHAVAAVYFPQFVIQ